MTITYQYTMVLVVRLRATGVLPRVLGPVGLILCRYFFALLRLQAREESGMLLLAHPHKPVFSLLLPRPAHEVLESILHVPVL